MDRLVLCPEPVIVLRLGLVRNYDQLVRCYPGHSLGRPVHDAAISIPRQRVGGARVRDPPAVRRHAAEPQRRGRLGYHRDPVAVHRDAAVVLEQHRFWQPDLAYAVPVAAAAPEHLDPPASRDTALRASPAPVALTQPEQVCLPLPVHARQAFQALIRPVKREVQPGAADIAEVGVVFLHRGHELRAAAAQRFDQHVEAARPRVVRDVLEAAAVAFLLHDHVIVAGRPG